MIFNKFLCNLIPPYQNYVNKVKQRIAFHNQIFSGVKTNSIPVLQEIPTYDNLYLWQWLFTKKFHTMIAIMNDDSIMLVKWSNSCWNGCKQYFYHGVLLFNSEFHIFRSLLDVQQGPFNPILHLIVCYYWYGWYIVSIRMCNHLLFNKK